MIRIVVAIAFALWAGTAAAHDRTVSYSTWEIDGAHARVTLRLTPLDVSRFPWAAGPDADARLAAYVAEHLRLRTGDQACPVTSTPARVPTTTDRVVIT